MSRFTLPVQYLRLVVEQIAVMGGDVEDCLRQAGLHSAQLADSAFMADLTHLRALLEAALQATGEPAFGLLLGERLRVGSHGILGYAALQSESLRQAIGLVEQYLALRTSLVTLQQLAEPAAGCLHLQVRSVYALGRSEHSLLEAVLLAISNLFVALSPGGVRLRQVSFPFAEPAYAALASELFGCPVRYAQPWAAVTLDAALLDQPLQLADPQAFREAEQLCQRELLRLDTARQAQGSLTTRVQRLLLERQQALPGLQATARLLHMTPRTLHRHLQAEGTSFQQLLDQLRHRLALEHLRAGRLSIQAIACSLGYRDVANFRRAFKRWQGVPPSACQTPAGYQNDARPC